MDPDFPWGLDPEPVLFASWPCGLNPAWIAHRDWLFKVHCSPLGRMQFNDLLHALEKERLMEDEFPPAARCFRHVPRIGHESICRMWFSVAATDAGAWLERGETRCSAYDGAKADAGDLGANNSFRSGNNASGHPCAEGGRGEASQNMKHAHLTARPRERTDGEGVLHGRHS